MACVDGLLMAHVCQSSHCITFLQEAGKGGAAAKKKSSNSGQENVRIAQRGKGRVVCTLDKCFKCFMAVLQVPASSKHVAATGKAAGKQKKVQALPLLSLPPGNVQHLADPEALQTLLQV